MLNALTWKKMKELKQKKIQLGVFIILPVLYLYFLYFSGIKIENIIAFYPLTFTLFSTAIHFSIEDLVSCGILLATNLSIKKIWRNNMFFIIVSGYIYSTFIMLLGITWLYLNGVVINLNINIFLQYFFNFLMAFGLIGTSTCHYSNYSIVEQLIASVFSLINIFSPLLLIVIGKNIFISLFSIIFTIILVIAFFGMSYLIISKSKKEMIINNIQKLVNSYNNNIIEE